MVAVAARRLEMAPNLHIQRSASAKVLQNDSLANMIFSMCAEKRRSKYRLPILSSM
jgi:hypothetical protein